MSVSLRFIYLVILFLIPSSVHPVPLEALICGSGGDCTYTSCSTDSKKGTFTGFFSKKFKTAYVSYNDGYFKEEVELNLTYRGEGIFTAQTPAPPYGLHYWTCKVNKPK